MVTKARMGEEFPPLVPDSGRDLAGHAPRAFVAEPLSFSERFESIASSRDATWIGLVCGNLMMDPSHRRMVNIGPKVMPGRSMVILVYGNPHGDRVTTLRARDADLRGSVFARQLLSSLEAEPLEDGVGHAADGLIEAALRDVSTETTSHLYDTLRVLALDPEHPALAADVLRCVGRQELPGGNSWRAGLIRDALKSGHIAVRDGAAQAADMWGDAELRPVLRSHSEPVPWLRSYVEDVIAGLTA